MTLSQKFDRKRPFEVFPGYGQEHATSYAALGEYVSIYQHIENFLPCLFFNAMAGDRDRDLAIFATVRGLEAKLNLVTAALMTHDEYVRDQWPAIIRRIAEAAKARNEMAHSRSFTYGEVYEIQEEDGCYNEYQFDAEFQLRKEGKLADIVWTEQAIRTEIAKAVQLSKDLETFCFEVCDI